LSFGEVVLLIATMTVAGASIIFWILYSEIRAELKNDLFVGPSEQRSLELNAEQAKLWAIYSGLLAAVLLYVLLA
jgi:hypothetical protein